MKRFSLLFLALSAQLAAAQSEFTVRIPVAAASHSALTQTVDFGNVVVGTSASRMLSFSNRGAEPTKIVGLVASGRPVSLSNNGCVPGLVLKASESCTFTATLTPGSAVQWDSALSMTHTAVTTPDIFNLRATGVATQAKLVFDQTIVPFGKQSLQQWSLPKSVRVTNQGTEAAVVARMYLVENAMHFLLDGSGCEGELLPGASCEMEASFAPRILGALNARVGVELEDGTKVHGTTLGGTGVQGVASFNATTLTFSGVAVGTKETRPLVLTNIGLGNLGVTSLSLSGDASFELEGHDCPAQLAPAESCRVQISVTPASADIRNSVLTLVASGTTTPLSRVQVFSQPTVAAPALEWQETQLSFGPVRVGQEGLRNVTLRSVGNVAANVTAYSLQGTGASAFNIVNPQTCIGSLAPGMQCTFQVKAAPGSSGSSIASLKVQSNAMPSPPDVLLSVQGTAPAIAASPASLVFPTTPSGQTAQLSTQLTNQGDADANVQSVALSGAPGGFTFSGCAGQTLPPGASCSLQVTFTPTSEGAYSKAALVAYGGPGPLSVPLIAQATPPLAAKAELSPFTCTPTPVAVQSPATCTALLRSTGNAALSLTSLTRTGTVFAAPTSNCPTTLAPGAQCAVTVVATASAAGSFNTVVTALTNAGAATASAAIAAQLPTAALATSGHGVVRVGATDVRTHLLSNTGSFPVTVTLPASITNAGSAVAIGGTVTGVTGCVSNQSLAPGQVCGLVTSCSPTSGTAVNATLSVSTSAGTVSGPVACQGEFPPATGAALQVSPNPVDFGGSLVSVAQSRTVTLTNTAPLGVTVSSISVSGAQASDFALSNNGCLKLLAAGSSCQLTVTATPAAASLREASLVIAASTATAPPPVALRVTGLQGTLSLSPGSAVYGTVQTGTSKAQSFTVGNTGTGALTVGSIALSGPNASQFALQPHSCTGASLAPGATCAFTVDYRPTVVASANATVTVSSSNASSAAAAASLTAAASPAPVAAATLAKGADCAQEAQYGAHPSCTVTVTSTGDADLVLSGYSLTRTQGDYAGSRPVLTVPNAAGFAALTGGAAYNATTGRLVMPPGSSAKLSLALSVQTATTAGADRYHSSAGTHSNQLALTSSVAVSPLTLSYVIKAPSIDAVVSPAKLNVVAGTSGAAVATVTNTGIGPVRFATTVTGSSSPSTLTLVSGPTGWWAQGALGTCQATTVLQPGAFCTVPLSCSALVSNSTAVARLTFNTAVPFGATGTSNSLHPKAAADVTCSGVNATATVAPGGPLTFAVATGSQSGNWMRFTNTSAADMTVTGVSVGSGFLAYTDAASSTQCTLNKVLQAGQACDFLEVVTKENTSSTALPVNSANHYVSTNRGAFSYASSYSVQALSITPVSSLPASMQKGSMQDVTLSVLNSTPSSVSSLSFTAGAAGTVQSTTCSSLAPGATCAVTLRLQPGLSLTTSAFTASVQATGRFERILNTTRFAPSATSTAGQWQTSVALTAPSVSWTPGTHGNALLGASSQATHVLTNTGQGPVSVGTPQLSGAAEFTVHSNSCTQSLAAGASCQVVTLFKPTTLGQKTGSMTLTTDAGVKSASLSAFGVSDRLVDSAALNFGSVEVTGKSEVRAFSLSNGSAAAVSVSALTLPPGVTRAAPQTGDCQTGSFSLAVGATCKVRLQWQPTAPGVWSGQITVNSNFVGQPQTLVSLSGNGVLPQFTAVGSGPWCSRTVAGIGTSVTCQVYLRNTGTSTVVIDGVKVLPAPEQFMGIKSTPFVQTGPIPTAQLQPSATNFLGTGTVPSHFTWDAQVDGRTVRLASLSVPGNPHPSVRETSRTVINNARYIYYSDGQIDESPYFTTSTPYRRHIPPGATFMVRASFSPPVYYLADKYCLNRTPEMLEAAPSVVCKPGPQTMDIYISAQGRVIQKVRMGAQFENYDGFSVTHDAPPAETRLANGRKVVVTLNNRKFNPMHVYLKPPTYYYPAHYRSYGLFLESSTCAVGTIYGESPYLHTYDSREHYRVNPGETCTVTYRCESRMGPSDRFTGSFIASGFFYRDFAVGWDLTTFDPVIAHPLSGLPLDTPTGFGWNGGATPGYYMPPLTCGLN